MPNSINRTCVGLMKWKEATDVLCTSLITFLDVRWVIFYGENIKFKSSIDKRK